MTSTVVELGKNPWRPLHPLFAPTRISDPDIFREVYPVPNRLWLVAGITRIYPTNKYCPSGPSISTNCIGLTAQDTLRFSTKHLEGQGLQRRHGVYLYCLTISTRDPKGDPIVQKWWWVVGLSGGEDPRKSKKKTKVLRIIIISSSGLERENDYQLQ